MRRSHVLMAALGALLWSAPVLGQSLAEADSAAAMQQQGGNLSEIGDAATAAAEDDSTALEALEQLADEGFDWVSDFKPILTLDVTANVQQITRKARLSFTADLLDGGSNATSLQLDGKDYRQQDRDSSQRNFDTSFGRALGEWAKLDLRFSNRYSEDTTIFSSGIESLIESDNSDANFKIDGKPMEVYRFKHNWAVTGDVNDVQGSNRGTNNDRTLASGGATSRWKFESPGVNAEARFGYDRAQGDRGLRGTTSDATTTQDTVGASLNFEESDRITVRSSVDRISFSEQRLDFRRNSSGVIDTLLVDDADKVGQEREQRAIDRLNVTATTRPHSRIALNAGFRHSLTESRFLFSQQGLEIRNSDNFNTDMTFRYARAGSLMVKYDWGDQWDDRRTKGSNEFRGRESRLSQEISFQVKQRLLAVTDFDVRVSQRLNQNVFEDENNQNDRDQLFNRFEANLRSKAIDDLQVNVGGTWGVTNVVNVDADRVGNNKEDRLFEARGGYTWTPATGFSWKQDYRMQIVFIDFHNSNSRDQFNKQGVLVSQASYSLAGGSKASLKYTVDFRRNGTRDPDAEGVKYRTDLRRFDHKVVASISVPVSGLDFSVDTTRGFLRDENPQAVNPSAAKRAEDRGEIRMRISGSRQIFVNATLRVDVERVLAYGPRVRDENEDYWVANSGLTVNF